MTTGSISFSKYISVSGTDYLLEGIAIDSVGDFYVIGTPSGSPTGIGMFIGKFSKVDGSSIWAKTISRSGYKSTGDSIFWADNYLYFGFSVFATSPNQYYAHAKIMDDGSVVDGTYGTYTFTTVTPTLTDYNSYSTSIVSGSPITYTLNLSNTSYTRSAGSYTVNTVSL